MASISKYSNLPGIAFDQPDVYETVDSSQASKEVDPNVSNSHISSSSSKLLRQHVNQLLETIDKKSDNVELIATKPKDAFETFKGKYLRVNRENANGIQLGFQTYGEWQINDNKDLETTLQKYYRLKSEVGELIENLQKVDGSKIFGDISTDLKPSDIIENLDFLKAQLTSLQIEENKKQGPFTDLTHNKAMLSDVQEKINAIKEGSENSVDEKHVTYSFYCNPELSKISELSKAQRFEQRIKQLEDVLGENINELKKMPNLGSDKSLCEIVSILSGRVSQMDAGHLEQIDSRLTSILHKFNQINEKKNDLIDVDKQRKINELYDLATKVEEKRAAVPVILKRLNNLEELQQQAIHFSDALSYLDGLQEQVSNSLEQYQEELKILKDTFSNNMEIVKELMQKMEQRIENLK